ncbi:MAG TPA: HAD hydrolase family protein [Phycisphaerae bacterium]|nr:HAD hydrolase family protein [Phycisphaerae bacterium]HRW51969.1 HAD hydrolase family protein [Phycisphaerae bacterium]
MIKLLILDVDGVLTTGALPYEADGNRQKAFYVQDGGAIRRWMAEGGQVAILSGREADCVGARARDLGIPVLIQGVPDKVPSYETICRQAGVSESEVAVMGDDLPDVPLLKRCGYPIAVDNAHRFAKRIARYVTRRPGGAGAIAEAIERLLRYNGTHQEA